jgi:hypothetical protein
MMVDSEVNESENSDESIELWLLSVVDEVDSNLRDGPAGRDAKTTPRTTGMRVVDLVNEHIPRC